MSRKEKAQKVREVVHLHDTLMESYKTLEAALGVSLIQSKIWSATWQMFDLMLAAVAGQIGDESEWLSWYVYENDCGARGMEAGYDGRMKPIRTAVDLVRLVEEEKK